MTISVILAAGMSTRMGTNKLLLPLKGKTVIENVVMALLASDVEQVVVVCGYEGEKIKKALVGYPITFIDNPLYAEGQSTSIVKSVAFAGSFAKGILFVMADQPLITAEVINQMLSTFNNKPTGIIVPFDPETGCKGAPVLFDAHFFEALKSLEGDVGGRSIIASHPEAVTLLPVVTKYFFKDVDTRSAYDKIVSFVGDKHEKNDA